MGCTALIQIMRGGQKVSVHISMELYVAHNNKKNQPKYMVNIFVFVLQ